MISIQQMIFYFCLVVYITVPISILVSLVYGLATKQDLPWKLEVGAVASIVLGIIVPAAIFVGYLAIIVILNEGVPEGTNDLAEARLDLLVGLTSPIIAIVYLGFCWKICEKLTRQVS